jgi:hypothetical protein
MKKLICITIVNFLFNFAYSIDYKFSPQKDKDFTETILNIIEENPKGNFNLQFEKGDYHFYPEKAKGSYIHISNHDDSYKRVAFDFRKMKNISVNGESANFIFHGAMVPFYFKACNNIKIEGITIDFDFSFVLEGDIINVDKTNSYVDVKITTNHKLSTKFGALYFHGYNWKMPTGQNVIFDRKLKRPMYKGAKYNHNCWSTRLKAKIMKNRVVRFFNWRSKEFPPVGAVYTTKGPHPDNRWYPAIVLHESKNIQLCNSTIHNSAGMGVIGESCENINLIKFNVKLKEGSNRMVSASADATHFISCKGKINFQDCHFSNMLDDATNVHGCYMKVSEHNDNIVWTKFGHFQQEGFVFGQVGDYVNFINRKTLESIFTTKIKNLTVVNQNCYRIETEDKIPDFGFKISVENISRQAEVLFSNCKVLDNWARGILLSTPKAIVENSIFRSAMCGVLVAGDANKWCETGAVSELIVRNNIFENIAVYGNAPQSALQVSPEIHKRVKDYYYHTKIVFENNTVKTFDSQVLYAISVSEFIVRNNKFIVTNDFKPLFEGLSYLDFQNCGKVIVEHNSYLGEGEASCSINECKELKYKNNENFKKNTVDNPNRYFYQQ